MIAQLLSLTYSLLECCIYNNLKREINKSLEKFRILSNLKAGHNTLTNIRRGHECVDQNQFEYHLAVVD